MSSTGIRKNEVVSVHMVAEFLAARKDDKICKQYNWHKCEQPNCRKLHICVACGGTHPGFGCPNETIEDQDIDSKEKAVAEDRSKKMLLGSSSKQKGDDNPPKGEHDITSESTDELEYANKQPEVVLSESEKDSSEEDDEMTPLEIPENIDATGIGVILANMQIQMTKMQEKHKRTKVKLRKAKGGGVTAADLAKELASAMKGKKGDDSNYTPPMYKNALSMISDHSKWSKFPKSIDKYGDAAFRWAKVFINEYNMFNTNYEYSKSGIGESRFLENVLPHVLKGSEITRVWYETERLREVSGNDHIHHSMESFNAKFLQKFVPSLYPTMLKTKLGEMRQHKFDTLKDMIEVWDAKLADLFLLGEKPSDDELWSLLGTILTKSFWAEAIKMYKVYDYASMRDAWKTMISQEATLAIIAMSKNNDSNRGRPFRQGYNNHYGCKDSESDSDESEEGVFMNFSKGEESSDRFCRLAEWDEILCTLIKSKNLSSKKMAAAKATAKGYVYSYNNEDKLTKKYPMKCWGCGGEHFIRDCPEIEGGSGTSVLGQRYGTAKGFRNGDSIKDRPRTYINAVKDRIQSRSKNFVRKGRNSGSTYAQKLKKRAAVSPSESQYCITWHNNLNDTILKFEDTFSKIISNVYDESVTRNDISDDDEDEVLPSPPSSEDDT